MIELIIILTFIGLIVLSTLHFATMCDCIYYVRWASLFIILSILVVNFNSINLIYYAISMFVGIIIGIYLTVKLFDHQYHNKLFRYSVRFIGKNGNTQYQLHRNILGIRFIGCKYSTHNYKDTLLDSLKNLKELDAKKKKKKKVKKKWLSDKDIELLKI